MATMDRCPICDVSVRPENLIRHLNDIHPRHPDTPRLLEQLRAEPGRIPRTSAGRPIRVRPWHVVLVADQDRKSVVYGKGGGVGWGGLMVGREGSRLWRSCML